MDIARTSRVTAIANFIGGMPFITGSMSPNQPTDSSARKQDIMSYAIGGKSAAGELRHTEARSSVHALSLVLLEQQQRTDEGKMDALRICCLQIGIYVPDDYPAVANF